MDAKFFGMGLNFSHDVDDFVFEPEPFSILCRHE